MFLVKIFYLFQISLFRNDCHSDEASISDIFVREAQSTLRQAQIESLYFKLEVMGRKQIGTTHMVQNFNHQFTMKACLFIKVNNSQIKNIINVRFLFNSFQIKFTTGNSNFNFIPLIFNNLV